MSTSLWKKGSARLIAGRKEAAFPLYFPKKGRLLIENLKKFPIEKEKGIAELTGKLNVGKGSRTMLRQGKSPIEKVGQTSARGKKNLFSPQPRKG